MAILVAVDHAAQPTESGSLTLLLASGGGHILEDAIGQTSEGQALQLYGSRALKRCQKESFAAKKHRL